MQSDYPDPRETFYRFLATIHTDKPFETGPIRLAPQENPVSTVTLDDFLQYFFHHPLAAFREARAGSRRSMRRDTSPRRQHKHRSHSRREDNRQAREAESSARGQETTHGQDNTPLVQNLSSTAPAGRFRREAMVPTEPLYIDVSSPEYEEMAVSQQPSNNSTLTTMPAIPPPRLRTGPQHGETTSFVQATSRNDSIPGLSRRPPMDMEDPQSLFATFKRNDLFKRFLSKKKSDN